MIELTPQQQSIFFIFLVGCLVLWWLISYRTWLSSLFERRGPRPMPIYAPPSDAELQYKDDEIDAAPGRLFGDEELKAGGELVDRRVRDQYGRALDELELLATEVEQLNKSIVQVDAEFHRRYTTISIEPTQAAPHDPAKTTL